MNCFDDFERFKGPGTQDCAIFRGAVFSRYRPMSAALSADYQRISKKNGYVAANRRLGGLDRVMTLGTGDDVIRASAPDSEVRSWCDKQAHYCGLLVQSSLESGNELCVREPVRRFVESQGLGFPLKLSRGMSEDDERLAWVSALARVIDSKWWRRQVRTSLGRRLETVARDIRLVSAQSGLYCSDIRLANRKRQQQRNRELLESMEAENQHGEVFSLADLADSGLANPKNRFSEMITRAKGNDEIAKLSGHVGWFVTLTAPSRFHRMVKGKKGCFANSKWDGSTPRDAQEYLCGVWSRVRAKWDREGIKAYGIRVAEPHHDGCPHWHMSLFFEPEKAYQAKGIFREYALNDSPEEPGAEYRFDAVKIDPEKGATGYLVKYLTKNMEGLGGMSGDTDFESQNELFIDDTQSRVGAWASCWGIRQFQFVGGPPVTVWRELRRVKADQIEEFQGYLPESDLLSDDESEFLKKMKSHADNADWGSFVVSMGGPNLRRDEYPIKSWRVPSRQVNGYYELLESVKGVLVRGVEKAKECMTRFLVWVVRPSKKDVNEEARSGDSWTCLNNCTQIVGVT